jgi:hypothetical protein
MKQSRSTEAQIIGMLKEQKSGSFERPLQECPPGRYRGTGRDEGYCGRAAPVWLWAHPHHA